LVAKESGPRTVDLERFLGVLRGSLTAILNPRFYESERGFQGQLLIELSKRIPDFLPDHAVLEQEHQKTLARHGLDIRPDVIIHQPFDPAIHFSRRDGNFAVIELKLRANAAKAKEDFESLHKMLTVLHYPLGIFININDSRTHDNQIPAHARGRIVALATTLTDQGARIVEAQR
jgi:hypothetical protein